MFKSRSVDSAPVIPSLNAEVVGKIRAQLEQAESVLIAAGAGMSVDAGFDYTSEAQFVARYPVLASMGPRCRYHLFGYPWPDEGLQWGHLARHLEELRFSPPPAPAPYEQLRALTQDKDRFVLTSNADDLFERSGFDPQRIWTRQGSYSRLQCLKPCRATSSWMCGEWVEAALPHVDRKTERLTRPDLIPRCPACGGEAMLNVRGGDWFLETPYEAQGTRFAAWLKRAQKNRLLVLDVGTGFNTPGVIRWPAEQIVRQSPHSFLVRVNKHHPQVPGELRDRAIGLASSGAPLWSALVDARR